MALQAPSSLLYLYREQIPPEIRLEIFGLVFHDEDTENASLLKALRSDLLIYKGEQNGPSYHAHPNAVFSVAHTI